MGGQVREGGRQVGATTNGITAIYDGIQGEERESARRIEGVCALS